MWLFYHSVLFGNIYSSDPNESTGYIAGKTKGNIINKLRVYISSSRKTTTTHFHFRHFLPTPEHCPAFPALSSCSCISRKRVDRSNITFAHLFTVLPVDCSVDFNNTLCKEEEQCQHRRTFDVFENTTDLSFSSYGLSYLGTPT